MRIVALALIVVVGVAVAIVAIDFGRTPAAAQQPPPRPAAELLALSSETELGRQQVVVIDARTRTMSVYHIEHATGAIALKSVRNIQADLLMDEFNTQSPLPKEIRAILDNK